MVTEPLTVHHQLRPSLHPSSLPSISSRVDLLSSRSSPWPRLATGRPSLLHRLVRPHLPPRFPHSHLRLPASPTRRLLFNPKPRICFLWSLRRRTGPSCSPNRVLFAASPPAWPCRRPPPSAVASPHFHHHPPLNTTHERPLLRPPKTSAGASPGCFEIPFQPSSWRPLQARHAAAGTTLAFAVPLAY